MYCTVSRLLNDMGDGGSDVLRPLLVLLKTSVEARPEIPSQRIFVLVSHDRVHTTEKYCSKRVDRVLLQ